MLTLAIGLGILLPFAAIALGSQTAEAEQNTRIQAGSTVFIQPTDGLETLLKTAMLRSKVALVIVSDRREAAFEITGYATVLLGETGSEEHMNVAVKNTQTGELAFSYFQDIQNSKRGRQSGAESFAKQLKARMQHSTTN